MRAMASDGPDGYVAGAMERDFACLALRNNRSKRQPRL